MPCDHSPPNSLTESQINAALDAAAGLCLARGQKWTQPRRRVYELLLRAHGPVKAYDLIGSFYDRRVAHPPTVYRALEFLERNNLVHRIASLNSYVLCDYQSRTHAAAFMICDCCGSATEFLPGIVGTAMRASREAKFALRQVALEVRGRCNRCA